MSSSKRNTLIFIVATLVVGYLFYQADSFWGVLVSALSAVWGLVYLLPTMDGVWRFKVGFVVSLFFGALVILIPTITGTHPKENDPALTSGLIPDGSLTWLTRNPIANYVRDHIATKGDFAIAPGLDLKGGLRLVYTVGVDDAIADKRDNAADEMRQLLATAFEFHSGEGRVTPEDLRKLAGKVRVSTPSAAEIRVHFVDEADKTKIDQRFVDHFQTDFTKSDTGANDVIFKIRSEVESQIRSSAVDQAKNTVHKRIDELGLREANLSQRDEDIIVEVPGSNEAFDRIKEIIAKTARLEFKLVDDTADFFKDATAARDAAMKEVSAKVEKARAALDAKKDDAGLQGALDAAQREQKEIEAVTIDREAQIPDGQDKTGKKGCDDKGNCYRTNYAIRTKIDDALDKDPAEKKTPAEMARDRLKRFVATYLQVPDDHQVGFEQIESPPDAETQKVTPVGWRAYYLWRHAAITGDYITDARVSQDQTNQRYEVNLELNSRGGDIFAALTKENVNRRFAIILDDIVDSAPVIVSEIPNGHCRITMGKGDPGEQLRKAHQLELVLRAGALPAPIYASSQTQIGASLGEDAIDKGVKGAAVGMGLVLAFMIFYYRKAGIVADMAVLFNLLLQMAVLASFGATMTLPGITGLALTVGMAVDANVLINERIREELRAGRSVRAAVEAGYSKALSSIVDGHVTVFISGLILAQYGSGPVKGFAVTLIVGIIASLFTGVFCTRLVFDWWTRGAKVKTLSVGAEF